MASLDVNNCQERVLAELCDLPSPLKENIATSICNTFAARQDLACSPNCETVKIISPLYTSFDGICVSFRDENGVYMTSCFSIGEILSYLALDADPKCIADLEAWESWDFAQKIQAIINFRCNCEQL